ncbi:nardilysin [Polypterus senegalus]|uniref:nardilysin n=1 Tax=Polypterus senegalus TaxID=55291 RepID=UPI001966170E|nr:nardilysin [Polypterus senegalus]
MMPGSGKARNPCGVCVRPSTPDPLDEAGRPAAEGSDMGAAGGPGAGDAEIVKSPSDPKQYRYIELDNGLKALLISDMSTLDGQPASSGDDGDSEEEGSDSEEEDSEGDSGEGTEEESEEEQEERDSDFEDLDDDSSATKKKSGCAEKQSAAALCIGVGSFSDPDDLPGLAHFLEHMVFMGSEKYPAENGFDAFLKKHGGSDNASTDCERTIFQFDVQRKYFKEALDRWAQFFICPLMIKDAVDREVEAVDSEYQLARPSDSHRKEMLFGSLAKAGHPMGKFYWGNADTLKLQPREKNIDTYSCLRDFWKRHYSAHYMTLAVQSKENLDTLELWVREIFSKIPNNGLPKPDFSHLLDPFDTPLFNKLYRVVPVRKIHSLTISWALPPQQQHYRVKPLHYISWLIGHEGTGSILSVLRKKCWAVALYGGNSETGFDQNDTYSVFDISVTLTNEGYQNFYHVADLVFQYLRMLQKLGPQQRIYEEIQKIESNEFRYQEQTDPIDYVENLCENMQLFPKADFLTGDQLMFEYRPKVISAALNLLVPSKASFLLLSPNHQGHCDRTERWFGTQYSEEEIEEPWRERWAGDFDLNPELHLPAKNKFIATDFNLKTPDCPDTEYPVKIASSDKGCLWYRKDKKFKIPRAYVRFHLISPLIQQSPEK